MKWVIISITLFLSVFLFQQVESECWTAKDRAFVDEEISRGGWKLMEGGKPDANPSSPPEIKRIVNCKAVKIDKKEEKYTADYYAQNGRNCQIIIKRDFTFRKDTGKKRIWKKFLCS